MAFVAVNKDGTEKIYSNRPKRLEEWGFPCNVYRRWGRGGDVIELPSGSIEKLIGRPLTWADEPVEI